MKVIQKLSVQVVVEDYKLGEPLHLFASVNYVIRQIHRSLSTAHNYFRQKP